MKRPRIEYIDDPAGLAVPFFWDPEAKLQVMPQEVAMRYNEMAAALDSVEAQRNQFIEDLKLMQFKLDE